MPCLMARRLVPGVIRRAQERRLCVQPPGELVMFKSSVSLAHPSRSKVEA